MAGGATAITHPAMQKGLRDMAAQNEARRCLIKAHRGYARSFFGSPQSLLEEDEGDVGFDCYFLCGHCGYLAAHDRDVCPGCRRQIESGDAVEVRDYESSQVTVVSKVGRFSA